MIITLLSEMQAPYFPRNKLNSAKKNATKEILKKTFRNASFIFSKGYTEFCKKKKKPYTLPNFVVVIYIYY